MLSNRDTVRALEFNSLVAIFVLNVTKGCRAILMDWIVVCLAFESWAQRGAVGKGHNEGRVLKFTPW
jgi:hypothetical protein